VSDKTGGNGAVRDFIEYILSYNEKGISYDK
jgi:3-deoxy-D-manno-octulosonate 8-phosphate phosphatase KdsC-like HAD superfamily phosphatase